MKCPWIKLENWYSQDLRASYFHLTFKTFVLVLQKGKILHHWMVNPTWKRMKKRSRTSIGQGLRTSTYFRESLFPSFLSQRVNFPTEWKTILNDDTKTLVYGISFSRRLWWRKHISYRNNPLFPSTQTTIIIQTEEGHLKVSLLFFQLVGFSIIFRFMY